MTAALSTLFAVVSTCLVAAHYGVGLLSEVASVRQALLVGPAALLVAGGILIWTGRTVPPGPNPPR